MLELEGALGTITPVVFKLAVSDELFSFSSEEALYTKVLLWLKWGSESSILCSLASPLPLGDVRAHGKPLESH